MFPICSIVTQLLMYSASNGHVAWLKSNVGNSPSSHPHTQLFSNDAYFISWNTEKGNGYSSIDGNILVALLPRKFLWIEENISESIVKSIVNFGESKISDYIFLHLDISVTDESWVWSGWDIPPPLIAMKCPFQKILNLCFL